MKVINGSSLSKRFLDLGFTSAKRFEDEQWLDPTERVHVYTRPDGIYAHVRVDTSGERPRVREIGLEAESYLEPTNIEAKFVDGIWIASVRLTYPEISTQAGALDTYVDSVQPIRPWTRLPEHNTIMNVVTGKGTYEVAPWLKHLPLEHLLVIHQPSPDPLDVAQQYRVAF